MKYHFRKHKKFYNGLFYFAVLTVVFGYGLIAGRFHLFPYMLINKLVKPTALYDYYEKIDPVIANVDVLSLISIKTETDVHKKRNDLIQYIWKDKGFPRTKMPRSIKEDYKDNRFSGLDNLKNIDRVEVLMAYGLNSVIYHFHPIKSNNRLVIYHQGHAGDFFAGKDTIGYFLNNGYSVLAFSMPLSGLNNKPTVNLPKWGPLTLGGHDRLKFLQSADFSEISFFVEPLAVLLNYIEKKYNYDFVSMIGISGGGWTTTLYSALDIRVKYSYPVSGSCPLYIAFNSARDYGHHEDTKPGLYRIANYLELYILGSFGVGRRQLQVLNKYDACCFGGIKHKTYKDIVKNVVSKLGKGSYGLLLDETHKDHKISEYALQKIVKELNEK